jgi:hypothetical protein
MASPNPVKPHDITFGTMNLQEAVARGVLYSPDEVTQMSHDPEDMPKVVFATLCNTHKVLTLPNAEYLVRLWNGSAQGILGHEHCRQMGTDVNGHIAWLLEEEVGKETFWRMLKQQATPPLQPEHALLALWKAAKDSRTATLRLRAVQFFTKDTNSATLTGSEPSH